jgi:hypothetical protein
MNKPGHFGVGDKIFDNNEIIISYNKQFDSSILNKIDGYLELPTIDIELFKYDSNIEKTDISIYIGKNKNPNISLVPLYNNILTRTSPSRNELVNIIKRTKLLYTFDNTTIIIDEARLAGCNVILIDDGTRTIDDINNNTFGNIGIHYY